MKNVLLIFFFAFLVSETFAQPLSGDYTVGVNVFNRVSGLNLTFEKVEKAVTISEKVNKYSLNQQAMEDGVESDDIFTDVIVTRDIIMEEYVPHSNGIAYRGSLYHEFSENDDVTETSARGVYATITAAVADLNLRGVSGPVRFLLVDNTYGSETFPITISSVTGSSTTNTVTILPATGVTAAVTGSLTQPIFLLTGASNIIFDGRQNGVGTEINFVITNNSTASSSTCIRLVEGSVNNTITHMRLVGQPATGTTRIVEFGASAVPNGNSNNIVTRSELVGSRYGVYGIGTAANPNLFNTITHNKIFNAEFAHFFFSSNTGAFTIENNEIYATQARSTANSAIQANASTQGCHVRFNKFYDLQNSSSSTLRGIYVLNSPFRSDWYVENNFISMTLNSGTKTYVYGLDFRGTSSYALNLYYNTVVIGGTHTGGGSGNVISAAFYKAMSNDTAIVNSKNNIFINTRTGGNAASFHAAVQFTNTAGEINSDYNNYFVVDNPNSILVRVGSDNYTTLGAFQAAVTPSDANSVSKAVNFVSATDLHLAGSSIGDVQLAGTPITGITVDIDGDLRWDVPYMGADEAPIPIPVELSSFSYNVAGNSVTLSWVTATETNNYGFEVERSSSNEAWHKLGFIAGAGTSTEVKNYSFKDASVTTATYYYRLKQIDLDGSVNYSNIIEVDVTAPDNYMLSQNYPNPFNPSTKIVYSVPVKEFVSLKLYDALGREVATLINEVKEAGYYSVDLNAATFSSGVYFYTLSAGSFTKTMKMILTK